ncbi:hypothetical protein A2U01_0106143, partial [Trifolium medium]|nr:hypothetical protein [Trifolium medium]
YRVNPKSIRKIDTDSGGKPKSVKPADLNRPRNIQESKNRDTKPSTQAVQTVDGGVNHRR